MKKEGEKERKREGRKEEKEERNKGSLVFKLNMLWLLSGALTLGCCQQVALGVTAPNHWGSILDKSFQDSPRQTLSSQCQQRDMHPEGWKHQLQLKPFWSSDPLCSVPPGGAGGYLWFPSCPLGSRSSEMNICCSRFYKARTTIPKCLLCMIMYVCVHMKHMDIHKWGTPWSQLHHPPWVHWIFVSSLHFCSKQ